MLTRLLAKKIPENVVNKLVEAELRRILAISIPVRVYLFGSAARGEMTDMSDIDLLAIYSDETDLKLIRREYYASRRQVSVPVDMIFYTESEFARRAELGGVPMICKQEGKILYDKGTII